MSHTADNLLDVDSRLLSVIIYDNVVLHGDLEVFVDILDVLDVSILLRRDGKSLGFSDFLHVEVLHGSLEEVHLDRLLLLVFWRVVSLRLLGDALSPLARDNFVVLVLPDDSRILLELFLVLRRTDLTLVELDVVGILVDCVLERWFTDNFAVVAVHV